MRKIILLLPLAIAFSAVLAFALVQQDSGEAAPGGDPAGLGDPFIVDYACYFAPGAAINVPVSISNQYEESVATVFSPIYQCPPTNKNNDGLGNLPSLRCYSASSPFPGGDIDVLIGDQYGFVAHTIGPLVFFCVPGTKDGSPASTFGPYYACYDSPAPVTVPVVGPSIVNQFESDDITLIDDRIAVCVPSSKSGSFDFGLPPLTCYNASSSFLGVPAVPMLTQFEVLPIPTPVDVGPLDVFCTEATKFGPPPTPTDAPSATPTDTPTATVTATPTITPTPTPPPSVNYTCYLTPPTGLFGGAVSVENQFGPQSITVLGGEYLCPPTAKNGADGLALPTLRCHTATGAAPGGVLRIGDQYGIAIQTIGPVESYCTPATKNLSPPPPGPYYVCYDILSDMVTSPEPSIVNQFFPAGDDLILADLRDSFCVPSLKFGTGDLGLPPLVCYPVLDGSPAGFVPFVWTQFGIEDVSAGAPAIHCTEAEKLSKLPDPGDTDGDGCSDVKENRPKNQADVGGGRNWLNPWDFYDVAIAGGVKGHDSQIDLFNDIVGVIDHYAPTGLEPVYDAWYDRGPSAGPNSWNMTAPDNKIDLFNDIVGVIGQFGHDCR